MIEKQSPYLAHHSRLADIVAALQVLGTYKFASRKSPEWEKSIGRVPASADSWLKVLVSTRSFFVSVTSGFLWYGGVRQKEFLTLVLVKSFLKRMWTP